MIHSVTLNPSVDRTLFVDTLHVGDTNRVIRTETDAGGKGINVARVAQELGTQSLALGFLGGRTGHFITGVLDEERVEHDFVRIREETRLNINIESENGGPPTTLNERGPQISYEKQQELHTKLASRIVEASFAVMGGSIPPGIEDDIFVRIMQMHPNTKFVVDSDGEPMRQALEHLPWMVKPNAREASRLLGIDVETEHDAIEVAKHLHSMGITYAIVSMGALGAALSCKEGAYFGTPPQIKSVSTIGSGDSLIAGFLCALSNNLSASDALQWGVAAGAATAMTNAAEICRKPVFDTLLPEVKIASW